MKKRAWQRMLSGRRLDLLDPTPLDIEIEDIAHGLAFLTRWNGQTLGNNGFSVAEHSLLVETLFRNFYPDTDPKWRMAALLHDAAEYVIGDLISPVKAGIGEKYSELEEKLMITIHRRFGLPATIPKSVKSKIKVADKHSAWAEATSIAGFSEHEANKLFGYPKVKNFITVEIVPRPPLEAKRLFLNKYAEIIKQI